MAFNRAVIKVRRQFVLRRTPPSRSIEVATKSKISFAQKFDTKAPLKTGAKSIKSRSLVKRNLIFNLHKKHSVDIEIKSTLHGVAYAGGSSSFGTVIKAHFSGPGFYWKSSSLPSVIRTSFLRCASASMSDNIPSRFSKSLGKQIQFALPTTPTQPHRSCFIHHLLSIFHLFIAGRCRSQHAHANTNSAARSHI